MASKSNFQPTSFSLGNTYNERTTKFVGVDLTSPQMTVDLKRGVQSRNYVIKPNGRVETRFGYEKIYSDFSEEYPVYGIWEYYDEDGTLRRVCAIGKDEELELHHWSISGDQFVLGDKINIYNSSLQTITIADPQTKNMFGTSSNGKLWLLTGAYFMVVYTHTYNSTKTLRASPVSAWSDTHVPIVTYMGVPINPESDLPSITNVTLEYPNMLSPYRKDMFLGGFNPTQKPIYELQTSFFRAVFFEGAIDVFDDSREVVGRKKIKTIKVVAAPVTYTVSGTLGNDYAETYTIEDASADDGTIDLYILYDYQYRTNYTVGSHPSLADPTSSTIGFAYLGKTGKWFVRLVRDYEPPVAGKPNITFKYNYFGKLVEPQFDDDNTFIGNKDLFSPELIDKCTIGALFGKNNSLNRLWLAGNPDKPNYAIHSDAPYTALDDTPTKSEGDFSYIPDSGITKFGESLNEIVAMVPMSADKMMVLKNEGGTERTMYFVTPFDVTSTVIQAGTSYGAFTASSDVSIVREQYSTSMSNTSTAGLSRLAVSNFNGDVVFLSSEKQLVGMDIEGITGDSQRVANTRSYYIDGELASKVNSDSIVMANGNELYILAGDTMYVTTFSSRSSETRQYEWWPCDAMEEEYTCHAKLTDGTFVIGTENGVWKIRRPAEGEEAVDIERIYFDTGDTVIGENSTFISLNQDLLSFLPDVSDMGLVKEDDLVELHWNQTSSANGKVFYRVAYVAYGSSDGDVRLVYANASGNSYYKINNPGLTEELYDGRKCTDFNNNVRVVHYVDYDELPSNVLGTYGYGIYFTFDKEDGTAYLSYIANQYVLDLLPSSGVYVFADTTTNKPRLFRKKNDGSGFVELTLHPQSSARVITGYFEKRKRITPYFATLRLTQGKIGYDKVIDNVTLWNDANTQNELYVGVLSNNQGQEKHNLAIADAGHGFGFESLNFENTNFDNAIVPKFYNLKRFPRFKQSFTICFTAKSKRNSVLSGIDILYRVKKASKKR